MKYLKPKDVWNMIEGAGNTIFRVSFIKRTNGERREMVCRTGVSKYVKGEGRRRPYNPAAKQLRGVFDMGLASRDGVDADKPPYRMVPLDTVISITVKGITLTAE